MFLPRPIPIRTWNFKVLGQIRNQGLTKRNARRTSSKSGVEEGRRTAEQSQRRTASRR